VYGAIKQSETETIQTDGWKNRDADAKEVLLNFFSANFQEGIE